MPPKKGRSTSFTGQFHAPIGNASEYSASAYSDAKKNRVSYTLTLYARVGEERARVDFGDERKWTINISNSELNAQPAEEATAAFLNQRFTLVANAAYQRFAACALAVP
jgi:hypothetical protein